MLGIGGKLAPRAAEPEPFDTADLSTSFGAVATGFASGAGFIALLLGGDLFKSVVNRGSFDSDFDLSSGLTLVVAASIASHLAIRSLIETLGVGSSGAFAGDGAHFVGERVPALLGIAALTAPVLDAGEALFEEREVLESAVVVCDRGSLAGGFGGSDVRLIRDRAGAGVVETFPAKDCREDETDRVNGVGALPGKVGFFARLVALADIPPLIGLGARLIGLGLLAAPVFVGVAAFLVDVTTGSEKNIGARSAREGDALVVGIEGAGAEEETDLGFIAVLDAEVCGVVGGLAEAAETVRARTFGRGIFAAGIGSATLRSVGIPGA